MSSSDLITRESWSSAPVRASRLPEPGFGQLALAGAAATGTLTVVTSGVRLPAVLAIAAGLIAMGAVLGAWLLAGHLTPRRLVAVAAAWGAPLLLARPLFSGDVWSYLAQGATAAQGLDPYSAGPVDALGADSVFTERVSHYWLDTPAPYGPAWMLLSRAVALLTGTQLTAGMLAYRLIAVAGVVLIAWALPRLAARTGTSPAVALRLGLLNPLLLWHLLAGVHNDALMLGLMLAGLELSLSAVDRLSVTGGPRALAPFAAGVTMLTLAANIKFVAGAAFCVVLIALAHRCRPVLLAPVTAVVGGALAGTVALSAAAGFGWISSPLGSLSVYSWMAPTTATGMLVGAAAGGDVTPAAVTVANLIGMAVCVPVVIVLLVLMARRRLDLIRGLGLIFTTALLCGAVIQPWYVLWAVLPLAAAAHSHRSRTRIAAVSAAFSLAVPPMIAGAGAMVAGYLIAVSVLGAAALLLRRHLAPAPAPALRGPIHAEPVMPRQRVAPMREHAMSPPRGHAGLGR